MGDWTNVLGFEVELLVDLRREEDEDDIYIRLLSDKVRLWWHRLTWRRKCNWCPHSLVPNSLHITHKRRVWELTYTFR
jgi:hypothetical protein